jgi:hypothetical protein
MVEAIRRFHSEWIVSVQAMNIRAKRTEDSRSLKATFEPAIHGDRVQGIRGLSRRTDGMPFGTNKLESHIDILLAAKPRSILLTDLHKVVVHAFAELFPANATHLAKGGAFRGQIIFQLLTCHSRLKDFGVRTQSRFVSNLAFPLRPLLKHVTHPKGNQGKSYQCPYQ